MNHFFFGDAAEPLFGAYHAPAGAKATGIGAVIHQPLGHEYLRSHRALRQLAMQLALRGVAVLRFDYFGTGDSAGEHDEVTLARMRQDGSEAAQELADATPIRRLVAIGLRAGAIPALAALANPLVSASVLWDPIVDGRAYLATLSPLAAAGPEALWARGFPYGVGLVEELRSHRLEIPARGKRVTVVADEATRAQLGERRSGDEARWIEAGDAFRWDSTGEHAVQVPASTIEDIVHAVVGD